MSLGRDEEFVYIIIILILRGAQIVRPGNERVNEIILLLDVWKRLNSPGKRKMKIFKVNLTVLT